MNKNITLMVVLFLFLTGKETFGQGNQEKIRAEYVRSGMTAYTEGNYRKAIQDWKKAFELDSTQAPLSYNIACGYSLLDIKDTAIIWLRRTIKLGTYSFSEDTDFDNIRRTKEFQELTKLADSLLQEAKKKEWKSLIFIPEDYDSTRKYPLFIMLHGWGSSPKDFTRGLQKYLTSKGFIFVVPYGTEIYGLSSFGWGSTEKTEEKIISEIENLREKYSIDPAQIILAGYSQGGSRAFSLGIRNADLFRGAIAIAGGFDEENLKNHLKKLKGKDFRLYVMVGGKEKPERLKSNYRAKEMVEAYGGKVHIEVFPEIGHAFPGDPEKEIQKALEFIFSDFSQDD